MKSIVDLAIMAYFSQLDVIRDSAISLHLYLNFQGENMAFFIVSTFVQLVPCVNEWQHFRRMTTLLTSSLNAAVEYNLQVRSTAADTWKSFVDCFQNLIQEKN